jgi:hypothetical protein
VRSLHLSRSLPHLRSCRSVGFLGLCRQIASRTSGFAAGEIESKGSEGTGTFHSCPENLKHFPIGMSVAHPTRMIFWLQWEVTNQTTSRLPSLNAAFHYRPGTVVAIAGKVIPHSVDRRRRQGSHGLCGPMFANIYMFPEGTLCHGDPIISTNNAF